MILWTLLFFAISAQGFYLSILLILRSRMGRRSDVFIGVFTFFVSLLLLFWVGFWNKLEIHYAHFNLLYNPIPFLISPLLYLYVLSFDRKLHIKDALHLLPFVVVVWYLMPFYVLDEASKIEVLTQASFSDILWNWDSIKGKWIYFQWFSLLVYGIACMRHARRALFLQENKELKKWILKLVILFLFYALTNVVSDIIIFSYKLPMDAYIFSAILLGSCIYVIGHRAFNPIKPAEPIIDESNTKKYSRSSLSDQEAPAMVSSIISYIENKKPYLKEGYKLSDLSEDVDIPTHHISELLNSHYNTSYSALINSYRVEEAKQLLVADEYSNIKISSIGYDVGFNSRTSFYQWFKKLTGLTPTAYQSLHKMEQCNS